MPLLLRLLRWLSLAVALASAWHGSAKALAAEFQQISCTNLDHDSDCTIALTGVVQARDVLFIDKVQDVDQLYADGRLIGATGVLFGFTFDAQILPRIYSLQPLAGRDGPHLNLHSHWISSENNGFSKDSRIVVTSMPEALFLGFVSLALPTAKFFLSLVLGAACLVALRRPIADRWTSAEGTLRIFAVATCFYELSMTKIPRIMIPSLVDAPTYYFVHVLVRAVAYWALALALLSVRYTRTGRDLPAASKLEHTMARLLRFTVHLGLATILVYFVTPLYATLSQFNALVAIVQSSILVVVFVACLVGKRTATYRDLPGSMLLLAACLLTSAAIARDSLVYVLVLSQAPAFWTSWSLFIAKGAIYYRYREWQNCQLSALDLTNRLRAALELEVHHAFNGTRICQEIQSMAGYSRVSLLSLKEDDGFLAASVGPEALPADPSAKPLGSLIRMAIDRGSALHLAGGELKTLSKFGTSYDRPMLILIFRRGAKALAALSIMAKAGQAITPKAAAILELAAASIGLEVLSFLDTLVATQTAEQLAAIIQCTSGIVFEAQDAWGRLVPSSLSSRRLIISADGLKTTKAAERNRDSALLQAATSAYKRELYAVWFGLLEAFEFVSKDVRGDDFWALSPLRFNDARLNSLGSAQAAVYLAHLLEYHARLIAFSPRYLCLGLGGAHVALGVGDCRTLVLGTKTRRCFDLDSAYLGRLHRIRALAMPGHILVDTTEQELVVAVATMMATAPAVIGADASFLNVESLEYNAARRRELADLATLPQLVMLSLSSLPAAVVSLQASAIELAADQVESDWSAA